MQRIGDLLARDLSQKIEEIIKLDQADEATVYTELTEYVATPRIKRQYQELLTAIAEGRSAPHEGVGVWISGFFGSGKSSFAKNLGYVLANRQVLGHRAADLFKDRVDDGRIGELVDFINAAVPTEVVMFDVSVDRAVRRSTERIAEVMYTVLLRELEYAEDYDIAELEIELEAEGKLDEFVARCAAKYPDTGGWRQVRKGALRLSRASAVLHELDPNTFPQPDSWAAAQQGRAADITVRKLVERTFELAARRRPGKALVFIIDEVGQYVARSADKILDLQAVVREFGPVGKNLVAQRKAVAPVWVIVTSQEKLDEVVAAIGSHRVELAKLQDSFKYHVDLAPADIREVATRRVLAKRPDAEPVLRDLFSRHSGQLRAMVRLERTSRPSDVSEGEFVQFYPYLPHFVELSIDVMSGIRLQPGAPKHLGGSNRTIIKQAYEMLVSERTRLAAAPAGRLVTLDLIYELVEGNLSSEKQKDISDIVGRFKGDPWPARVAKAIALLEFVRDLPRTETNLAALLYEELAAPSPRVEVERVLGLLQQAQFVRHTEEGYKLLTAQEKNWDTERRTLAPKPKDRNEITREVLADIFADPKLKTYRYKDLRTFPVGIEVDGTRVGDEGKIPVSIWVAEDVDEGQQLGDEKRTASREGKRQHEIFWVMVLTNALDDLLAEVYRAREMVRKYDQLRAQGKITAEEAASLANEKSERGRLYRDRLRPRLEEALHAGTSYFRGVARAGPDLGKTAAEAFRALFDQVVPDLYPKLELGARALKGNEAELVLREANLAALPPVFYEGDQGLDLILKEGTGKFVPNPTAEVAKEVLDYVKAEQSYGNKVTGRMLEERFEGLGYGWDRDVLKLVLAVLLRHGSMEVTHQGRRFRNHLDPQCRVPFANQMAFRAASFAPRESIDLRTLTAAVAHYEQLTGEEVEVEEATIAAAFKRLAGQELAELVPIEAVVQANELPAPDALQAYRSTLQMALDAASDDCVRILAGEGNSLLSARGDVRRVRQATTEDGLRWLRQARAALRQMWPQLQPRVSTDGAALREQANALGDLLQSPKLYADGAVVREAARAIEHAYRAEYERLHRQRGEAYTAAIEQIKGMPEWLQVQPVAGDTSAGLEDLAESILQELAVRAGHQLDLVDGAAVCAQCQASIGQMVSDVAAVEGLKRRAVDRLHEAVAPPEPAEAITRVRLREFFGPALASEDEVKAAIEQLREYLLDLVRAGVAFELD